MNTSYKDAKTQLMRVGNENIAYRRLGDERKPVLLFLNHLAATLDNCDPAIMDGFAKSYSVIAIDYRGVGKSTGKPRRTIEEMADDVLNFVEAMNLSNIRLLGFSLGGFVAQQVLLKAPNLCVKAILAGTGGAGGKGISRVGLVTYWDMLRGLLTFRDPKYYLFFPMIAEGKTAARDFLKRIKRRTECDDPIRFYAFQAQLCAISLWEKGRKTTCRRFISLFGWLMVIVIEWFQPLIHTILLNEFQVHSLLFILKQGMVGFFNIIFSL